MEKPIYLDHCATTPLCEPAKMAMAPFLDGFFGNPAASHHAVGRLAADLLESSRANIARIYGAPYRGIVFTGSATEANNIVLQGFALRHAGRGARLLYGATEHKSVLETALALRDRSDLNIRELPVLADGTVCLNRLEDELQESKGRPCLVALMHTNNEIPVRHPVEQVAAICQRYDAYFHCDAVQGVVRETLDFSALGATSTTISPHKIYGPAGLGILLLAQDQGRMPILPLLLGGGQEGGLRSGTVNLMAVAGSAAACEYHESRRALLTAHALACQQAFVDELKAVLDGWHLTVPLSKRSPGIVNFWIERVDSMSLLSARPQVAINRGAACSTGGEQFSYVPQALGMPIEVTANVLRASFGLACSVEECRIGAKIIAEGAQELRARLN